MVKILQMDLERLEHLAAFIGDFPLGSVSLVGAGPGDSGLVTVRGAVRLMQADVVLHDKLIDRELLRLAHPQAEVIFVGKWRGRHVWTQEEINTALIAHARAGRRVVRLKGGDPFVFGRGGEECLALAAAGITFEVVPGVTAAFGAPAAAGIPLTHRGLSRSFALVTGHAEPGDPQQLDFAALAKMETIVFYMGVKKLGENCRCLMAAGFDPQTPAAVIQWGTQPNQRTVVGTVETIAARAEAARLGPPALVLVGKVVSLREQIEWFERRPLHGQRIAVTRMQDQAAELAAPLAAAGAEVIAAPTIGLGELDDYGAVDAALRDLGRYAWVVFTSANGVSGLFARLKALGMDSRQLALVRIAAIGSGTAARLAEHGLRPDLIPEEAVGESVAAALIAAGISGKRILLPRAEVARPELPNALAEAGGICDDLPVYRTLCPQSLPQEFLESLDRHELNWITLTSPSSFNNLVALLGPERRDTLRQVSLASIGPVTTRAIRESGYDIAVEAKSHDVSGLVAAIMDAVRSRRKTT